MMKTSLLLATAIASLCVACSDNADTGTKESEMAHNNRDATQVTIANGDVVGVDEGDVVAYKGIPFAQPPVGDLRWRAPQPIENWDGTFEAKEFANDCMQIPFEGDAAPLGTPPAEDCLYMNVWKPAGTEAGADLPVIFWIYGGGWVNGGSSPSVYNGAPTAAKGVVFVSFNYRLGRFGFFAHPALTAADEDNGHLGNYGYMDQVAALKWVQENVSAFGGDPNNVTIMGESAGGGAVANHIVSPASKGLFHKALAMSAPVRMDAGMKPVHSEDGSPDGEADGLGFASWAGIEGEGPEALAALRALPADKVAAGVGLMRQPVAPATGPMVDGTYIVKTVDVLNNGEQTKVPTMAGAVSEDIGWGPELSADELFARYPDPDAARAAYSDLLDDPARLRQAVYQDSLMQEPTRFIVEAQAEAGQPAYHYRYGYVAETMRDEWTGTQHATEIPFFLNTIDARYPGDVSEKDQAAANLINDYLVNFARTGDPNGDGLPEWPAYTMDQPNVMNITFEDASAGPDPWQARLDAAKALANAE